MWSNPRHGPAVSVRERFLEALLESAIDYAIISLDLDGLVTSWNEGAHRILDWTEEEMIGQPASIFFTLEDRQKGIPQAEMQAALHHGRGTDERWHQKKDGSRFWANGEMMPLKDEHGTVQGYIKILRDRTARRIADEKQRADAEFLRSVLASSDDCIKVLDLDANLTFMNEGGKRIMEVSDFNAIQGCPWPDFWEREGHKEAKAAIEAARAGRSARFQGLANTMAGTPRWWDVQVTPILGLNDQPAKILAVSRDITELKETAQRLAMSEERLSRALGASGAVGIFDWDLATNLIHVDSNLARIYGLDPRQGDAGYALADLSANFHPDDMPGIEAALEKVFAGTEDYSTEHRILVPDGSVRWVAVRGSLVRDGEKRVRFPGAVVDITERRQSEDRQRLLMTELAHRVKNTLAMVQAIASQTLRGKAEPLVERDAFTARLLALAQAHDVLMQGSWTEASLRSLVEGASRVHGAGAEDRFRIAGADLTLGPKAALSFALALHELGTNAAKYGALSTHDGLVLVAWRLEGTEREQRLVFEWREAGGPVVTPPTRQGFGTRLIERSLSIGTGAKVSLDFPPTGAVFTLDAPLAGLQDS